ncbi:D-alanine--D-alanine ligase [Caproiciproducens galactitolivorans]|uniref:D-alanine--D-alanine ligase n=1 Tax=Caproiciproducens galactitolivorans TaxID=642589 RepID=A0A4Z0Y8H9_9FIRM|nr:D-alanine--D-alanine ligase family protein [Caproiciproducens galactitolivorans]QEY34674.1 D-alanine--D-alanine ligase [Caproiciproducens galactitolivorans]TGJ75855.1 D-alanine--D-alanine ligase A [Caproiciproducens galactitolivorans]
MGKKKIAVVFGGCSSEHEISCISAASVIDNLPKDKYEPVCLGITKKGRWYLFSGPTEEIADGRWEHNALNVPAFLSPDRDIGGIVVDGKMGFDVIKVDCVFPVLHGRNGEDGTIQGLLQLSGIPFVGCRALASADCMDKAVTHTLLTAAGIHQAKYLWFYAEKYKTGAAKIKVKIDARLGYPIFVKPANAGSSVGVSKVMGEAELDAAVAKAANEDDKIVVEEAIVGQEVECAVLGNAEPEASIVGEISASAEFYDYDDKYKSGTSKLYIPARLDETVAEEIRANAVRAYRMLGCTGLARVDFFVREGREVILNELNTMPGFTSISMYPKLWEASGLSYGDLLDRLIKLAFEVKTKY